MTSTFSQFKFIETPGVLKIASLTPAHHPRDFMGGTDDPKWIVLNADGTPDGNPKERLTYWGTDGQIWTVGVHASYDGNRHSIEIWLDHSVRDTGDEHDDSRQFAIRDWDGVFRELEISTNIANHTAPVFWIWK